MIAPRVDNSSGGMEHVLSVEKVAQRVLSCGRYDAVAEESAGVRALGDDVAHPAVGEHHHPLAEADRERPRFVYRSGSWPSEDSLMASDGGFVDAP